MDNRVVHVDLTPAGREILQGTPLGGVPLLRQALQTLPAERLSVINAAMTDLVHLLELEYEN
jgi:DNA-binding MarR family transcriptional regulator